jgi:hypothetical protein
MEVNIMKEERQNLEAGFSLGELIEALYDGVIDLPLSEAARDSLVTIMLGDIIRREGRTISFLGLPRTSSRQVAA